MGAWDISERKVDKLALSELTEERQKVNIINVLEGEKIDQEGEYRVGEKRPMWLDQIATGRWGDQCVVYEEARVCRP